MDRKTKALLFLAGAGIGGLAATYLLARSRREEVREAARGGTPVASAEGAAKGLLEWWDERRDHRS